MTVAIGQTVLVGIGEMYLTSGEEQVLVARCLGSSAAIAIYDPKSRVAGLLHWMLPDSRIDPARAERNPFMFADTGLPRLIEEAVGRGARRESLKLCLAGAAALPDGGGFDVGPRNRKCAIDLASRAGMSIHQEETGGTVVRELYLDMGPGDFLVRRLDV